MRSYLRLLSTAAFLLAAFAHGQAQCYRLVWADEFDGTTLNTDNWSYQIGDGCPSLCGWGNNELQYYREENVEVSGGTLKIHVRNESFGGSDYTSARIRTKDKAAWTYGRFEARMKMPSGGRGYWPAFWMLSEEDHYGIWPLSGEIDIMEMVGHIPNKVTGTIHFGPLFPDNRYIGDDYFMPSGSLDDGFHDYAIEWDVNEIRWYLDGIQYATRTRGELDPDPWRFDRNFHLILNCAVGGWFPGFPDATSVFPDTMEIDYVRVYQDVSATPISGRGTILANTEAEPYYVQPVNDASYTWSLPAGSSLISGAGTAQAQINWGATSGTVQVDIAAPSCTTSIARDFEVLNPDCSEMLLDHEDNKLLYTTGSSGGYLFSEPNPDSDSINNSSRVGRYARNAGEIFDAIRFVVDALNDASPLETGALVFEMDVYSISPPGSQIDIRLEKMDDAVNNFPSGRHSIYSATTTIQDGWERLRFTHQNSPDPTVGNGEVNQLLLMFEPGTTNNSVYWFDNLRIVDAACAASPVASVSSADPLRVYPNPSAGLVRLEGQLPNATGRILDPSGRVLHTFSSTAVPQQLDLQKLPAGHYYLEIQSDAGLRQRHPIVLTR
jgi:beta-glucanase (GH16 family)